MKLAFVMPSQAERTEAEQACIETILEMRQDQIRYLEHLLRSWGIFGREGAIEMTWKAIQKTLNQRP